MSFAAEGSQSDTAISSSPMPFALNGPETNWYVVDNPVRLPVAPSRKTVVVGVPHVVGLSRRSTGYSFVSQYWQLSMHVEV